MNNEWAMVQLQAFIASTQYVPGPDGYGRHVSSEEQVIGQAQVVEQIFDQVIQDWRDGERVQKRYSYYDPWEPYQEVAHRALAQLKRQAEIAENLGDLAPNLNAARMHRWVWDGARSLWAPRHFREAVSAAAVKVNAETQNKVKRFDISESKLFQESFSLKDPEPNKPRLRLMPNDGSDTHKSLHEGVIAFATGCYRAIRNPAAHVQLADLSEDEALEQLAAFSILARWVDTAALDEAS